jgi:hypothetical protein
MYLFQKILHLDCTIAIYPNMPVPVIPCEVVPN